MIRREKESEYYQVELLTREAFWNVYYPGCNEHLVLHNFRNDEKFVKELDLVYEENDKIVAHIMYCKVDIKLDNGKKIEVLMFGPISVLPEYQSKGYGSKLINYSIDKAKELGYEAICITGNPAYYHRFGFVSASEFHLRYPGTKEDEAPFFMALELQKGFLDNISGELEEPKCYYPTEQELKEFDKNFPYKEALVLKGQMR